MHLFDNHNHSEFSFDGKRSSVEKCAGEAVLKGLSGIAFTDHCDFFVPESKKNDEVIISETFDVSAQQEEIDRVQDLERSLKILKGIEIGLHENHHEDILRTLKGNSFDQVIASVHYLDGVDPFYGGYYEGKDCKEAYGHYLETIYKEMTWLKDFDIMGHYDYVVRYAPYEQTCMRYRDFSDITLDNEVLIRYRELGGEIVSLGSDSHDPGRVGHGFGHFALLLKSLGFRWTAHYEKRKLVQLPL